MKKTNLILIVGLLTGLTFNIVKGAAAADDDFEIIDSLDVINFDGTVGEITKKHLSELLKAAKKSQKDLENLISRQLQPKDLWKVLFAKDTSNEDDLETFKKMSYIDAQKLLKFAYQHLQEGKDSNSVAQLKNRKYFPIGSLGKSEESVAKRNDFIRLIVAWTADSVSFEIFKNYFSEENRSLNFLIYRNVLDLEKILNQDFSFVDVQE